MASISTDKSGNRTIQFIAADKRRRSIRLGKIPKRAADVIKAKVEALNAANIAGVSWDKETAEWLGGRGAVLYDKLAGVGLVSTRSAHEQTTLGPFVERYIVSRASLKPGTTYMLRYCQAALIGYFGADKAIADVTEGDAELYREHVRKTVAENTARTHCARARQFFAAAVKHRLIEVNPFCALGNLNQLEKRDRMRFIHRADIDKVIELLIDPEMKLLVALSRYGGLRVPSEPMAMKFGDIDWERSRLTVHCVKTERHEGKEERVVPLFPEILPHLEAVYDAAADGQEFVIVRHRLPAKSLARRLQAAIQAAGLQEWPKPWHNMRGSRETELVEEYPAHVVCGWIGNSQVVARKHYLQTTEQHFARALHNPVQQRAATDCDSVQDEKTTA